MYMNIYICMYIYICISYIYIYTWLYVYTYSFISLSHASLPPLPTPPHLSLFCCLFISLFCCLSFADTRARTHTNTHTQCGRWVMQSMALARLEPQDQNGSVQGIWDFQENRVAGDARVVFLHQGSMNGRYPCLSDSYVRHDTPTSYV